MTIKVQSNDPKPTAPTPSSSEGTAATSKGTLGEMSAPGAKAPEQNEAAESETAARDNGEATEGNEQDSSEPAGETEGDETEEGKEGTEAEPGQKRKSGWQKRIDKLSKRTTQAQAEAEYWKREALKNATAQGTSAPKNDPAKPADAQGKPKADDFEDHASYVEALTDWKVDQARKADRAEAQKSRLEAEQAKALQSYSTRAKAFAEKTEDFQEVLEQVDGVPVSQAVHEIILQSENGPELAYELAKNPEEFARVCKLPPIQAAREMGKLEARIASQASQTKLPETKSITKAPKPLSPLRTGGKGSVEKTIYDPNLSQREYEALRAKERAKASG